MGAVGALWRDRARRRRRSWVVLVVVLAVGAGAGLACLAGARRTASTFDRIAAATGYMDASSSHGLDPEEAEAIVAGLDSVGSHTTQVGFAGSVDQVGPADLSYFIGSWREPLRHAVPILREGRVPDPDRPEEVLVQGPGPVEHGVGPGDHLTFRFFTSDFSSMTEVDLVVVGIGDDPLALTADATYARNTMYLTPAFTERYGRDHRAWSATRLVLAEGAGEAELLEDLQAVGWSIDETRSETQDRVQDSIRPLLVVVVILGALLLVATTVVVGQSVARQGDADRVDGEAARALGCTPRQLLAVHLAAAAAVAVPGALLAVVVAVGLSPLFPTGDVRRLDPGRGVDADLTVLGLGPLLVVAALAVVATARRRRRITERQATARPLPAGLGGGRPAVLAGLRLAVGGTVDQRRRFRSSVAVVALTLVLVVGGVGFVASIDDVGATPSRFGATWDLTSRNAYGDVDPDALAELLAGDDDIAGYSAATVDTVRVDGENVPLLPVMALTADLWPTVVEGRTPVADDEVLVGADVLDAIGAAVGDEVLLEEPYAPAGEGRSLEATVVGVAVFPAIEMAGVDPTRLGSGVAMPYAAWTELAGGVASPPDFVFFDLHPGVDPAAIVERYGAGMPETAGFTETEWFPSLAPAEVIETQRATGLVWALVALLAGTMLAGVGHSVAVGVRAQRRDHLALRAMGFTRRQVAGAVGWESVAPVAVALVVAVPVGIAAGRWAWRLLAGVVGIVDVPVVPVATVAAVVVVTLAGALLVSVGPGRRAATVRTATAET